MTDRPPPTRVRVKTTQWIMCCRVCSFHYAQNTVTGGATGADDDNDDDDTDDGNGGPRRAAPPRRAGPAGDEAPAQPARPINPISSVASKQLLRDFLDGKYCIQGVSGITTPTMKLAIFCNKYCHK